MTPDELVTEVGRLGMVLEVRGEQLHIEAPAGVMTPELLAELGTHKWVLIARLAPVTEYVTLKGGLVLPLPALQLAWSLENRGFRMSLDPCQQFVIEPTSALTDNDRAGIVRWWLHLSVIVEYTCPESELPR